MDQQDLKTKVLRPLLHFRALGYLAGCALIAVGAWSWWSQYLRSTIVIEAGPKGGFFDTTAILLQKELQHYDIRSKIAHREDTLKIIEDVNDKKPATDCGAGLLELISGKISARQMANYKREATKALITLNNF